MPPVWPNGTTGPLEPLEVGDPVSALRVRLEGPQGHAVVVGVRSFTPPSQRAVVTAIDPWTRVGPYSWSAAFMRRTLAAIGWPNRLNRENAVRVGNNVRATVVGIDPERRRLSLSIRQADERFSQSPNV